MERLKMLAYVCAVAVLLSGFPAAALIQINPPTEQDSGVTEPATASTEKELADWLKQHTFVGGTLRLTGDITVANSASGYWISNHERIIDCGEYVINVTGYLSLVTPNLTIKGQGNENGMIRAQEGGQVWLETVTFETESGLALWQEEGAGLSVEPDCTVDLSTVHFAEQPVVSNIYMGNGLIQVVPKGDPFQPDMPKETKVLVNKDGACTEMTLPIKWDTGSVSETLDKRIRTKVTGSFDGMTKLDELVCTVVFHDRDVVFTWVGASENPRDMLITLEYLLPERPLELMLEYSFDETEWFAELTEIDKDGQTMIWLIPEEGGVPDGTEILWPEGHPLVSFCFNWQENGKTYYSDIVRLSDGVFSVGQDIGGNRGGGTDLGGDGGKPPVVELPGDGSGSGNSSDDGNDSGDNSSSGSGSGSSSGSGSGSSSGSGDGSSSGSGNGSSSDEGTGGGAAAQSRSRLNLRPNAGLAASSIEDAPPLDILPIDGIIEVPQPMMPTEATVKPQTPVPAEGGAGGLNSDRTSPDKIVNVEETVKTEPTTPQPDRETEIAEEPVPVAADADDSSPRSLARSAQTAAGLAVTAAIPLGFVFYRRDRFVRLAGKLFARFRG